MLDIYKCKNKSQERGPRSWLRAFINDRVDSISSSSSYNIDRDRSYRACQEPRNIYGAPTRKGGVMLVACSAALYVPFFSCHLELYGLPQGQLSR